MAAAGSSSVVDRADGRSQMAVVGATSVLALADDRL